jgi:hypothetical protein
MSNDLKWTNATLDLLFEQIVKRYGPHSEWEQPNWPGRGLTPAYKEFLASFAKVCDANSGDAVGMVIMLAAKPKLTNNRIESILASALRYGFINVSNIAGVESAAA